MCGRTFRRKLRIHSPRRERTHQSEICKRLTRSTPSVRSRRESSTTRATWGTSNYANILRRANALFVPHIGQTERVKKTGSCRRARYGKSADQREYHQARTSLRKAQSKKFKSILDVRCCTVLASPRRHLGVADHTVCVMHAERTRHEGCRTCGHFGFGPQR